MKSKTTKKSATQSTKTQSTKSTENTKPSIKDFVYALLTAKATRKQDNVTLAKIAKKRFPKSAMKPWHISRYRYNLKIATK